MRIPLKNNITPLKLMPPKDNLLTKKSNFMPKLNYMSNLYNNPNDELFENNSNKTYKFNEKEVESS